MDQGKKREPLNPFLKYSSLAIQMVAIIALAAWAGLELDAALHTGFPVFLLLFVFMAFGGMMYRLYISINRES
ncbi:MAG: AtpZ/AtpI family protein [Bacteroidota bacterium]